jgi:hypothetical protein
MGIGVFLLNGDSLFRIQRHPLLEIVNTRAGG